MLCPFDTRLNNGKNKKMYSIIVSNMLYCDDKQRLVMVRHARGWERATNGGCVKWLSAQCDKLSGYFYF